jgi:hypothetical protein
LLTETLLLISFGPHTSRDQNTTIEQLRHFYFNYTCICCNHTHHEWDHHARGNSTGAVKTLAQGAAAPLERLQAVPVKEDEMRRCPSWLVLLFDLLMVLVSNSI